MEQIDPAEIPLRDIHLPEPISWWPLAPGWWAILGALILLGFLGWIYWRFKKNAQQRFVAAEIERIRLAFANHNNHHTFAKDLSMLARQVALLHGSPKRDEAGAVGQSWLDYWQQRIPETEIDPEELAKALTIAPYRSGETLNVEKILAAFKAASSNKSARTSPAQGLGPSS
ncbi:MAG: DUF4381 domain-containing protein [Pseudomonadota bacterium]